MHAIPIDMHIYNFILRDAKLSEAYFLAVYLHKCLQKVVISYIT